MAGVLGHALAPEIVGEDAPAQWGSGPHVRVVDDRHTSSCTNSPLKGAAVAQAARPGQQRAAPAGASPQSRRREGARSPPPPRGRAGHHHRAAAAVLVSPGCLASSRPGPDGARQLPGDGLRHGRRQLERPLASRAPLLRRGLARLQINLGSPRLPGPSPPPLPHCACPLAIASTPKSRDRAAFPLSPHPPAPRARLVLALSLPAR